MKKKGVNFYETILIVVFMSLLGYLISSSSALIVVKKRTDLNLQINNMVSSYVTEGKGLCVNNGGAPSTPWIINLSNERTLMGNTGGTVTINCHSLNSTKLFQVDVSINIPSINQTKTGVSYVYVP